MKKTMLVLATILILTGCGKKKPSKTEIICTKEFSDSNSVVTYEAKYIYEEDNMISASTDTTMKFTTEGLSSLETFKGYATSSTEEYNKKDGVKAKLTINDNSINIVVDYDIAKMSEDEIENYMFNSTIMELRDKKEEEEYTCK